MENDFKPSNIIHIDGHESKLAICIFRKFILLFYIAKAYGILKCLNVSFSYYLSHIMFDHKRNR